MPARALLIEVRLLDGRYHGVGDWPPAPFRLFQALVAGAYGGRWAAEPPEEKDAAFRWLERLEPPFIAAPAKRHSRETTYYVPNNDLDAFGGDPDQVAKIRVAKLARPLLFEVAQPFLYAWPFDEGEDHARLLCALAERLHTLGRGIDAAYGRGTIVGWEEGVGYLAAHGHLARPGGRGDGTVAASPTTGSLDSLKARHAAFGKRFRTEGKGRKTVTEFRQPPWAASRGIPYDRPAAHLLFELRRLEDGEFAPQKQERAADLAAAVRDLAAANLARQLPERAAEIERVVVGRGADAADTGRRLRFLPLPSIGMEHTDPGIRRILVEVPPDCPFTAVQLDRILAGQEIADPETGVFLDALLVPAGDDDLMLRHYGIGGEPSREWRSVTPVALPARRLRGRLAGGDRADDERAAAASVADALRQAGFPWRGIDVAVQAEPPHRRGARAEAFLPTAPAAARFSGRLRHVAITFPEPVAGPIVIGDGRFVGLGLFRPHRSAPPDIQSFAIDPTTAPPAGAAEAVAKALSRAVMARVADELARQRGRGARRGEGLPTFFTGHEADGSPARPGRHEHLFFLAADDDGDGRLDRLAVVAPDRADRSPGHGNRTEIGRHLRTLDRAVAGLAELRAGRAGILRLQRRPVAIGEGDPLLGRSRTWVSRSLYRVTRHGRAVDRSEAVRLDVVEECARRGLARPAVDVLAVEAGQGGLAARLRLTFATAVDGPLLLGRGSHYGAGLFAAER